MRKFLLFWAVILVYTACKTTPPLLPPEKMPVFTLTFDRIEGSGINQVVLYYRFKTENPRSSALDITIGNWSTTINGHIAAPPKASLKNNDAVFSGKALTIEPGKEAAMDFELHLDLDLAALENSMPDTGGRAGDDIFITELSLEVSYKAEAGRPINNYVTALTRFPKIREPEFSISSIAIMQAELINTRFAVALKINNPNPFPITLSSFKYELYGHELFWADGCEENVLTIPAASSAGTRLFLMMNFINMKRDLLDEIIAMQQVSYRFTGAAEVITGISWLPQFTHKFDRAGYSEVFK